MPVRRLIKLGNRKILGLKCRRADVAVGDGQLIVIPDMPTGVNQRGERTAEKWRHTKDWTNWVKVVRFNPDCKYLDPDYWKEHYVYMIFPEWHPTKMVGIGGDYFIMDERILDDGVEDIYKSLQLASGERKQSPALAALFLVPKEAQ